MEQILNLYQFSIQYRTYFDPMPDSVTITAQITIPGSCFFEI